MPNVSDSLFFWLILPSKFENMKKILMLSAATLLFASLSFADNGDKGKKKKCAKGKSCCSKSAKSCSKEKKSCGADKAKTTEM